MKHQPHYSLARKCFILLLIVATFAPSVFARDVFVMLSGGDSPFDNNYSQFLQARAVTTFFEKHYPPDSVWIFFGAGNVEGEKPMLADVCRQVQRDGISLQSWLPGSLPHNLPARRSIILGTLRDEILPAIADGGTLFLFVGDHGSRTHNRNSESAIDLWSLAKDTNSDHGWRTYNNEILPVSELRGVLSAGIGKGRVVFCMTQCHAGGFHYLAIPHDMTPNPKWFADVPDWALPKTQPVFPNVAGFTATDEFSLASGCDPDPDSENWAGYERYVPENLLGLDLFTLKPSGKMLRSFAEAHVAATLQDATIDKPASTSEQYLERWSHLLDTRLTKELNLTPKVRSAVATYERIMNGSTPKLSNPEFSERQKQFRAFIEKMSELDSGLRTQLLTGTRKQLEDAAGLTDHEMPMPSSRNNNTNDPPRRPRGGGQFGERRRLWREIIRPAWKTAVEANQVTNLSPAVLKFEKHLLDLEDEGQNFLFGGGARLLQEEVFWESGFGDPQSVDATKADAVARWGQERRTKILGWAGTSVEAEVRDAATRMARLPARRNASTMPSGHSHEAMQLISIETAAERTLFYRHVLAAWEFLITVNERPALDRIHELTTLERTPLPASKF